MAVPLRPIKYQDSLFSFSLLRNWECFELCFNISDYISFDKITTLQNRNQLLRLDFSISG